jgi:hypothetical protein
MNSLMTIDDTRCDAIVAEAIRSGTPVVLTFRRADGWATFKSSFVPREPSDRCILIAKPPSGSAVEPGQRVGVAFRRGHKKCVFTSTVSGSPPPADAGTTIVLGWPEALQQMQRRVYHRAVPPSGETIRVRFWTGHVEQPNEDPPSGAAAVDGVLQDVSAGGIRVLTTQAPDLAEDAPVVCSFATGGGRRPFVLNALFRHCESRGDGFSCGFQFIGLESQKGGTDVLAQLVRVITNYQRAAARQQSGGRWRRD